MREPQELLKTLVDELRDLAQVKTIIGEPMALAGKTIIPVTRIMVGFGGGSGEGKASASNGDAPSGGGGGGGGGVKIEPADFTVLADDKISIMAVPGKKGVLDTLIEAAPELLGKISEMRSKQSEKPSEGKESKKKDLPNKRANTVLPSECLGSGKIMSDEVD
ncbi:sporulation protein [Candidatus Acetothermia bacterium]|nr:sporulation protein [Candidatus Acetothermia bacterium]